MASKRAPAKPREVSKAVSHLAEVRSRLLGVVAVFLTAAVAAYPAKAWLLEMLLAPLIAADSSPVNVQVGGVSDLFFVYLQLCMWFGVLVAVPYAIYQVWRFVSPALYPHERGLIGATMAAIPLLFYAGVAFAYVAIVPLALEFFLGFQGHGLLVQPMLPDYLSFVFRFALAFGCAFLMPVALVLLMRMGVVSAAQLAGARRYVIVGIFVVAAVMTPPDPFSQLLMAVPLLVLFEAALFVGKRLK